MKNNKSLSTRDLIISLTLTGIIISLLLVTTFLTNNHKIYYGLDDAFIHLSHAKNFINNFTWGVTKYEFTSSSSSIMFPILIGILSLLTHNMFYIPLIINILSALLLIYIVYYIFSKENFSRFTFYISVFNIVFFVALTANIISGMEHIVQMCLDLIFIYYIILKCSNSSEFTYKEIFICGLLSLFVCSIRFEGLFILITLLAYLIYKKNYKIMLAILVCGLLPVVIFGIISLSNNSYFLPNSVLLKGENHVLNIKSLYKYLFNWVFTLWDKKQMIPLFCLMLFNLIYYFKTTKDVKNNKQFLFALISFIILMLHLSFAKIGWFYRYEAYLIVLAFISFAGIIDNIVKINGLKFNKNTIIYLFIFLIAMSPLIYRGASAFNRSISMPIYIYKMHGSMAEFVTKYYNTKTIAIGDIGAVCYFSDAKILDVNGLANNNIAKKVIHNEYNRASLDSLSKASNVDIAIIYTEWKKDLIPYSWKEVGELDVYNYINNTFLKMSFFSAKDSLNQGLRDNLIEFKKNHPELLLNIF